VRHVQFTADPKQDALGHARATAAATTAAMPADIAAAIQAEVIPKQKVHDVLAQVAEAIGLGNAKSP